jgi:hypothetical protein
VWQRRLVEPLRHEQHHEGVVRTRDVRLGYFPNVTHAGARHQGDIFKKNFAKNVTLEPKSFSAGLASSAILAR